MQKYRGARLVRAGVIGVVLTILVVLIGLSPEKFVTWATAVRYQAVFTEAGGLKPGNDVVVAGVKVGTVSGVSLDRGDVLVDFTIKASVALGADTSAHIRIGTILGERRLVLESGGHRRLQPLALIPVSRTSSPYSLTDALSELTVNAAGTDTNQLNQSLDTLSATLDRIAPQLGPTFDGLSRLSRSLNSRNESLRDLLRSAAQVTGILSERSQQVNTLFLNANLLMEVLVERRQALVDLLAHTAAVSKQLSGLVADNEAELAPTLDRLNTVAAVLEKNRDNLNQAIPGLRKASITQGEALSSGSWYNAYVGNLLPGPFLQPFIDAAFGVQPRALLTLPNCGGERNRYMPPYIQDHCLNRNETTGPFIQTVPHGAYGLPGPTP